MISFPTVADLERIPRADIPRVLAHLNALAGALTARLLEAPEAPPVTAESKLLDAAEAAAMLNVLESWLRTEARAGRLPCVRLGKYVRFNLAELEQAYRARRP